MNNKTKIWKTLPSSIVIGTKALENTTLKELFTEKINALHSLDNNLTQFFEAIENSLSAIVGHLPYDEIKNRCHIVSKIGDFPFTQKYYLDEKLIFETEIKLIGNKFFWEIRKPGEAQES